MAVSCPLSSPASPDRSRPLLPAMPTLASTQGGKQAFFVVFKVLSPPFWVPSFDCPHRECEHRRSVISFQ